MYLNEESKQSFYFNHLAFLDYIAARKLFLEDYCFQGLVLASTAVEKYLKSILILKGLQNHSHLDKLGKFYKQFDKINYPIEPKLDSRFMDLLSKAYKLRYFDKIKDADNFGFFINQVLCELDYTVNLLDGITQKRTLANEVIESQYVSSFKDQSHPIHINNYLSLGISKKEFMERPSRGFGIKITSGGQILFVGFKEVISEYNGLINCYKIE
jgi:hypothetical protein